jgi:hypothetical protein
MVIAKIAPFEPQLHIRDSTKFDPGFILCISQIFYFFYFLFFIIIIFFLGRGRSSALRPAPNLEVQVSVFVFPNDRMAQLYTKAQDSFSLPSAICSSLPHG